ncbi:MAG: penicillin acylase family protein [Aestuariibacter sp.]
MNNKRLLLPVLVSAALTLIGCGSDGDNPPKSVTNTPSPSTESPSNPSTPQLPTPETPEPTEPVPITAEGALSAEIKRTSYGVPHITANSLEEIAYGTGYTQAQDHLCILADAFVKANSRRSEFFGPHASINIATGEIAAEDNGNLVSDFGYLATGIRAAAEANIDTLPPRSQAILSGFATGYNKYLSELATNPAPNLPCAGQAWVEPITGVDLLTYMYSIALLPGAANFLDLMFFANPGDGDEYLPRLAGSDRGVPEAEAALQDIIKRAQTQKANMTMPERNPMELGSNGWGLGGNVTDNGKGIVLANPHFPHTGQIRFHQTHLTIPGHMDVIGGSLIGMPGAVNIGFNENVAWTHTFSTAEHFVVYQLGLVPGDRESYVLDGQALPIEKKTFQILVNVGTAVVPFEKDMYVTAKGPMIEAPPTLAPLGWDDTQAFYVQDANNFNNDVIEHWVAMNLAKNIDEFQQAFKDYDGVIFNNTMYADDQGNAWYIDDSTVPGLAQTVESGIANDPTLAGLRAQVGFTVLPGVSSLFSFDSAEPYENAPKLLTNDYVQNSNDSYWLTNAETPINEVVSPLYGPRDNVQSLRSRMGHKLLNDSRGDDNLFSAEEVEAALFSNRSYFAEMLLEDVLLQCEVQGDTPVTVTESLSVDIQLACSALAQWNGAQNADSIAGALVRELAYQFCTDNRCDDSLSVPFDVDNPTTTPTGLPEDGSALVALAIASENLSNAGFALDAPLGQLQFVEKSLPDGSPSGAVIPWSGANNREGGFNVFAYNTSGSDGTLLPQHSYTREKDVVTGANMSSGLTDAGYHVRYGSSWMMVMQFTDDGPVGRGILTFSQSNNFLSEHWNDQTLYYSSNNSLRPILYKQEDIDANLLSTVVISEE